MGSDGIREGGVEDRRSIPETNDGMAEVANGVGRHEERDELKMRNGRHTHTLRRGCESTNRFIGTQIKIKMNKDKWSTLTIRLNGTGSSAMTRS